MNCQLKAVNCKLITFAVLLLTTHQHTFSQGTIAYIRGATEIRLMDPDGKNDRRLWTHPDASFDLGLNDLSWRPDGKELAFSSAHAAPYSIYHADIYCIQPDGTGFRKVTNGPDRSEFGKYPKGSVTVTVLNMQYIFPFRILHHQHNACEPACG